MFHKDGHVVWVHDEATMVRDERGMPRFSHGVMMDISDRKRGEEDVAFLAYHDELTGLPCRSMFEELLELSLARARRHDGRSRSSCVDVDDFRLVNDSLGHRRGDELLRLVADRLREATRETDLVARRGGDQFLMLLADLERDGGRRHGRRGRAGRGRRAAGPGGDARRRSRSTAPRSTSRRAWASACSPRTPTTPAASSATPRPRCTSRRRRGPAGYVVSSRGAFDSRREAAVRHPAAQGGREPALDPALPAGGRAGRPAAWSASRR